MASDRYRRAVFHWRGREWLVGLDLDLQRVQVVPQRRDGEFPRIRPGGGFLRPLEQVRDEARSKPRGLCAKVIAALDSLEPR